MPLVHLLYRCPECGHDPLEGEGDKAWCVSCGARFERGGEGGRIRVQGAGEGSREPRSGTLVRALEGRSTLAGGGEGGPVRRAGVEVQIAPGEVPIRGEMGDLIGYFETLGPARTGVLVLEPHRLVLLPGEGDGAVEEWQLLDIRAIQTSSRSVQIAPRSGGVVAFRFPADSPRRWEGLLQNAVRGAFRRAGREEIVEFQPRIVTAGDRKGPGPRDGRRGEKGQAPGPLGEGVGRGAPARGGPGSGHGTESGLSWYGFFRGVMKILVLLGVRMEVSGIEHIPRSGPFFLLANHQSVLDPILVQTACPRPLHTFTKSTQFSSRLFQWILIRVNAIPTRRYRVDPQVVRVALRRLAEGRGVGIYPEGERSWDGELQPFRQGTVRLLLKAGVPVIPCGIDGSYDVWPRWSRILRRRTVRLAFGEPLRWPALDDRRARDRALPEAMQELRQALLALGAWSEENPGAAKAGV